MYELYQNPDAPLVGSIIEEVYEITCKKYLIITDWKTPSITYWDDHDHCFFIAPPGSANFKKRKYIELDKVLYWCEVYIPPKERYDCK